MPAALPSINCGSVRLVPMILSDISLPNLGERICGELPTVRFRLAPESNTGRQSDLRTNLAVVNLTGEAAPNATVRLEETGATARADNRGNFTLRDVSLRPGSNVFTVRATDPGGNQATATQTINRNRAPVVDRPVADVNISNDSDDQVIDLSVVFNDADIEDSFVRFLLTSRGKIDIELFDHRAPQTVRNFLNYVSDGRYRDTVFHRLVPNFVLQGGGFRFDAGNPASLPAIRTDPPVPNEYGTSNFRGTIALAKLGNDPNSGTSQFFFNLIDNNETLGPSNNGGFTVFGQVIDNGLEVLDRLAAIPVSAQAAPFNQIPLEDFPFGTPFPGGLRRDNLIIVEAVQVLPRLQYTVVSNSNPNLVIATAEGHNLRLDAQPLLTGSADITIRGTDRDGFFVETTIRVNVGQASSFGPLPPVQEGSFTDPGLLGIRTDLLPGAPDVNNAEHDNDLEDSFYVLNGYSNPPTYGPHRNSAPTPGHPQGAPVQPTGVYTTPLPDVDLVHNLEHGHVWISYNPDLIGDNLASLEALVRSFGNRSGVVLTPRPATPTMIALASWAHLLTLDSYDPVLIRQFALTNRGHAPEGFITP